MSWNLFFKKQWPPWWFNHELSYILAELFIICRSLIFQIVGRSHWWSFYLRMFGEKSTAKNYRSVSLLSVVSKVLGKLVNNRIVDQNVAFFLLSRMVLGCLHQMQIF